MSMTDPQPAASLVRLYVDEELPPTEREAFERRLAADADLQRQVTFERALRERVARTLTDRADATPAGLADRVQDVLRQETAAPRSAPVLARLGGLARDPRRANALAVAASLLLVAAAVLFGIFGRPIDSIVGPRSDDLVARAATWASQEHARCATERGHLDHKATVSADQVQDDFRRHLGIDAVPAVFDLEGLRYRLVGGGHCEVPGPVPSGHLVYRYEGEGRRGLVSVFMLRDIGQFGDVPPGWQSMNDVDGSGADHRVMCTTDGGLVFMLVCCRRDDLRPVAETLASQLRVLGGN